MNVYDFKVQSITGEQVDLAQYKGKILLIVNIATKCGLTPQLEGLEKLYQTYQDKGFEVLGFPCNQFLEQSPEDNEGIIDFCQINYGVSFTNFAKIEVNGVDADPLFKFLKSQRHDDKSNDATQGLVEKLTSIGQVFPDGELKWNFTKFLINQDGEVVERFSPTFLPEEMSGDVEGLL
ncbi:glutathione peroxidase [Vibrio rumoiensis]|uniref:Glutathione peroxidase n=1 Tax=Vibrio rumoiensis 1S-45 TaxID=1188252 RepID=A0A1E5E289_9VIBR|nr:glutathione peroxidase [Vibrio rumoiensis]OEF25546.1 glutathione peroxidase [Vibrio rumoiensis 1S-45]